MGKHFWHICLANMSKQHSWRVNKLTSTSCRQFAPQISCHQFALPTSTVHGLADGIRVCGGIQAKMPRSEVAIWLRVSNFVPEITLSVFEAALENESALRRNLILEIPFSIMLAVSWPSWHVGLASSSHGSQVPNHGS